MDPAELDKIMHALSHDLSAPVRQIRTYGALLRSTQADDPEAASGHLDAILDAATQMDLRLKGLSRLVRLAGADYGAGPTDLGEAIGESLDAAAAEHRSSPPAVTIPTGHVVAAGRERVVTIFRELFGNSLAVCPAPVLIGIDAAVSGHHIRVEISDNGPGFGTSDPARAFRVFKRIHPSQAPSGGVGLTLAQRLAEDAGGSITLGNADERGARVAVSLPMASAGTRGGTDVG